MQQHAFTRTWVDSSSCPYFTAVPSSLICFIIASTHLAHLPLSPALLRYLYDNLLENTQGMNALQSVTHLYLTNNKITDMSHLTNMPMLQKLYLQVLLWLGEASCVLL